MRDIHEAAARVCEDIMATSAVVLQQLLAGIQIQEAFDAFRRLQDQLNRLVDLASDTRTAVDTLHNSYPELITRVSGVLTFASQFKAGQVAAVREACEAINHSLLELTKPELAVMSAGA
jgi:hypothetical protein